MLRLSDGMGFFYAENVSNHWVISGSFPLDYDTCTNLLDVVHTDEEKDKSLLTHARNEAKKLAEHKRKTLIDLTEQNTSNPSADDFRGGRHPNKKGGPYEESGIPFKKD